VVSNTLEEAEWRNSLHVAEQLTALKQQPGKNIGTVGSATLVASLLREGVLDELRLLVHPVVVGRGRRLFPDGVTQTPLELVDTRTFSTGVVQLTYRP
jgi:dihydrofolate reductase